MIRAALVLVVALACASPVAHAGADCTAQPLEPDEVARAAATALTIRAALDASDAPLALVARAGTDLSKHGLHYSHVGIAVREHRDGAWTVVHLLNHCGSDQSHLHAEGLVNFFADRLVNQDVRVVWLEPVRATRLRRLIIDGSLHRLHEPRYNLIARTGSRRWQNSTSWILEMLAAADADTPAPTRREAAEHIKATAFQPDIVHVPYSQRVLGGLFGSNVAFTDHPIATRLSGDYPVVTVRAIVRWLEARRLIVAQREWIDGVSVARLGPL